MKIKLLITAPIAIFVIGCASTTQFVKYPTNREKVESSAARIYIIRTSSLGSAVTFKIYQDEKLIGKLGPKSYLSWDINPGEIRIKSTGENSDYLTINAQEGKTYYILQRVKMGVFFARGDLELMDASKGEQALMECKKPKINYTE